VYLRNPHTGDQFLARIPHNSEPGGALFASSTPIRPSLYQISSIAVAVEEIFWGP